MSSRGARVPHLGGSFLLCHLSILTLALRNPPEQDAASYEVIIPRQLGPRGGDPEVVGRTSYLLRVEGRKRVIHLRPKKLLVSRRLRVYSFTRQGAILEDQPYIPDDCSYGGYVEGVPNSLATFNTCFGGLRGMLNMNGSLYQMEPLKNSTKFEHILYHLRRKVPADHTCQATDEIIPLLAKGRNQPMSAKSSWSYLHPLYVEAFIVETLGRYLLLGLNVTANINEVLTLIATADTVFQAFNCRISLVGMEIWSNGNKFDTHSSDDSIVYKKFVKYKEDELDPRIQSDWAHLILARPCKTQAKTGAICTKGHSASMSSLFEKDLNNVPEFLHALGHILGLNDDSDGCVCAGPDRCVMNPTPGIGGLSDCSYSQYFDHLSIYSKCMTNKPDPMKIKISVCGDKVVNGKEECDCGTANECKEDMCCEPTCKLKAGAKCGFGLCCHKCRFQLAGKLCRPRNDECDLEEFCNGTSGQCPYNAYIQDGTPCSDYGYCYKGLCSSRNKQCKKLFGHSAISGPLACYEEANQGDRFGNCGFISGGYSKCEPGNVLCGRLQCVNVKGIPSLPDHHTIVMNFVNQGNLTCWGIDYHIPMKSMKLVDIGEVKEGAACGEGFLCINKTCTNMNVFKFECTIDTCTKRGICNNNRNCHCDYGWAPPFCKKYGFGGSIDSGPPPKAERTHVNSFVTLTILFMRFLTLAGTGFMCLVGKVAIVIHHFFG